jgi:hypothetical protein
MLTHVGHQRALRLVTAGDDGQEQVLFGAEVVQQWAFHQGLELLSRLRRRTLP